MTISPGSASTGSGRCGGSPSISPTIAQRWKGWRPWALVYPAFESRAEIRALIAAREAAGVPWPRDPDGAPLYPGSSASLDAAGRARRIEAGDPFVLRLDTRAALARLGQPLDWEEEGEGQRHCRSRWPGATWCWRARTARPAITWRWWSTTPCRASPTWCAAATCFAATAVHRLLQALLGLPAPAYRHHRLILDEAGRKLSKSTGAAGLAALRAAGATPADIRRLVGAPPDGLTWS